MNPDHGPSNSEQALAALRASQTFLRASPNDDVRDAETFVHLDLTEIERKVLLRGLGQFIGPAPEMSSSLARAIWFDDSTHFYDWRRRIREEVERGDPLTTLDWHRVVAAIEICFISLMNGIGGEWNTVTGIDDGDTLLVIRALQNRTISLKPWPTREP